MTTTKPAIATRDASDALQQLFAVTVEFERWWNEEESEDRLVDGVHAELTNHRVLMEFFDFFAQNHGGLSEAQRRALGAWVSEAVATDDDLGVAVATCFLRNCRDVHLERVLAPYLSASAKAKSRA
jgi:hypothetical protein